MNITEVAAASIIELHHAPLVASFNAGELEILAEKILNCRMILRLAGVETVTADAVTMTVDEAVGRAIERINEALLESVTIKLTFVKKAKFEKDWFGNTGVTVTLHRD